MIKEEKIVVMFIIVLAAALGIIAYQYKQRDLENTQVYYSSSELELETNAEIREESQTKEDKKFSAPEFDSSNMHNIFGEEVSEPSRDYEYVNEITPYYKPEKFIPKVYWEDGYYIATVFGLYYW